MTRDWYAILGVPATADADTIRGAYLDQARLHHPDADGGTTDRMQQINDAWAVLGDEKQRAAYDAELPDADRAHEPEWAPTTGDGASMADIEDRSGAPVVGVARAVITFAPVCFVGGMLVFGLGVVLQVAGIVQAGLLVLLASLVAFLMAPFLAMGASRHRSESSGPDTVSEPPGEGPDQQSETREDTP